MGWFDNIFGDENGGDQGRSRQPRDPFGRIEPEFDAFRRTWKAGASFFGLFGDEPVRIKQPVGPEAPNRRGDVAKVETFLGRTGHLDLSKTDGPTGYWGSRVDQGIRGFQEENGLNVDGVINPGGPTITVLRRRIDATPLASQRTDPCLDRWLDARAATERVLAIRREIVAKEAEIRGLEIQIEARKSGSPGSYTPAPYIRQPTGGGRSRGARGRDAVEAIGEAISLGADVRGAENFIREGQARLEQIITTNQRITMLKKEITSLSESEALAIEEEKRRITRHEACKQVNRPNG